MKFGSNFFHFVFLSGLIAIAIYENTLVIIGWFENVTLKRLASVFDIFSIEECVGLKQNKISSTSLSIQSMWSTVYNKRIF